MKIILAAALCLSLAATAQTSRECFDFNWRFLESDIAQGQSISLDDSHWQQVSLPHDWDIYHAPDSTAASGNDGGYYPGGVGWYRKQFLSPKTTNQVMLHFEGVYQNCQVFINGTLAAAHHYGYTPFSVDITSLLAPAGKKNIVAVRVDNSQQPNCRWYSGSGIYRHVWLETFTPGAIDDPTKLFVRTTQIYGISSDGARADSAAVLISYEGQPDETRVFRDINLWSPASPTLYDIHVGSLVVKHGFRQIDYSPTTGLLLNNQPILVNGACVHHDDGILGAMAYDAAEIRKVALMKEAGFNLIRTSHNPTTTAFLNACDSLGMMVIGEAFDGWRTEKTPFDYHTVFDSLSTSDIAAMVLRDRNHPSIICWSIGNEVIERKDIRIVQTARTLKNEILRYDTSRPVTEALCAWDDDWDIYDPHAEVLDIVGYNYMMHKYDGDHARCPDRVIWQTESYPRDAYKCWFETTQRPYVIGDIVWTGLDYLGEAGIGQYYHPGEPSEEHYLARHFPFHGAYCGDVDITGWRKPISHYRSMLWNPDSTPAIYLAVKEPELYFGGVSETLWSVWPTWESWNWEGWEGKDIEIEAYTRGKGVKLFLNDKLIATQKVDSLSEYKATFTIPYTPGKIRVAAIDIHGQEIGEATLSTASEPYHIRLTPDRTILHASGEDISFIVAEVVDESGHVVPNKPITLTISTSGSGRLLAAGTANMQDNDPTTNNTVTTYQGRALIAVASSQKPGQLAVTINSSLPTIVQVIKVEK